MNIGIDRRTANAAVVSEGTWFNRGRIIKSLENVQDAIVIAICIGLFGAMVVQLWGMFQALWPPSNFSAVTSDILFLLILVEMFRLLIIYLQEHEISIGVAVEVSVVSVLREVIVHGVLETNWSQILAASAFVCALSLLLKIRCSYIPGRLLKGDGNEVESCCG